MTTQPYMKKLMHIVRNSMLAFILVSAARVVAQGTAFTYQGRLNDGAGPASGNYDLRFAIYDATSNGNLIAGPVTNSPTAVSNGLFAVTLDFGGGVFTGPDRWLEIGVRTNRASPTAFTTLAQRQKLTPSPYAIFANAASNLSGTISSANLSGTYSSPVTFSNGANTFNGTFIGQFLGSTFTGGTFTGNFIGTGSGLMDVWHTGGNFGALTVEALRELCTEKDARIAELEKGETELRKELAEARAELTAQKEIVNKMAARFDSLERTMARLGANGSAEFAESQAPAEPK
jgi:hypothetical protein